MKFEIPSTCSQAVLERPLPISRQGRRPLGRVPSRVPLPPRFPPQVSADLLFWVIEETAYVVSGGWVYTLPVVHAGGTLANGVVTVANDTLSFHYQGSRYTAPAGRIDPWPPGALEGEGLVIDETLYVVIGEICYEVPVVQFAAHSETLLISADTVHIGDYRIPVVLVGPSPMGSGTITAADDLLFFHDANAQWKTFSVPGVAQLESVLFIDDVLVVTIREEANTTPTLI